jgi:hypothetical protein
MLSVIICIGLLAAIVIGGIILMDCTEFADDTVDDDRQ